ncbi:MAG: hypothetical protein COB20_13660 [SAR86 cluster bacterium]|uniref:MAPEG family protein n=1 Tax=SAR86 cluster bacterium TaxID=2030880 RepID=A0A2A4WXX4_9GAMM|nr:MAG: hypothetical protein COB20_13660 [SAR86 cluster bacterium]
MHKYRRQLRALVSDILQGIGISASECSYMVGIIVYGQVRASKCCLMQLVGIILWIDYEQTEVVVGAQKGGKMLYAMFMLVILTTVIMVLTARVRIGSVKSGEVPQSYYSLMDGHDIPDFVAKTTRNFNNLFEVPTLFYAAGAVYLALDQTAQLPVISAWIFVAARVMHSIIHLSYNNVLHRLVIFAIGNLSVLVMWLGIVNAAG